MRSRPDAGREQAGDRMDRCHFKRFLERQRRQNPGHPPRHHRLARAGRAESSTLCPPAAAISSARLARADRARRRSRGGVRRERRARRLRRRRRPVRRRIVQRGDGFGERCGPGRAAARRRPPLPPHCAPAAACPRSGPARRCRDRQDAARRLDPAVERQLAEDQRRRRTSRRATSAGRRQDAERNRQVERRAGLAHVGGREVDRDAMRRELEAGVADRAAHAVAALAHARVRQPDHRKRRAGRTRRPPRSCTADASTPNTAAVRTHASMPRAVQRPPPSRMSRNSRGGGRSVEEIAPLVSGAVGEICDSGRTQPRWPGRAGLGTTGRAKRRPGPPRPGLRSDRD